MSVKKKRPTPIMPTKMYDISKTLGAVDGGYGGDELDDAMKQMRKIQADKLKSTMVEKVQLEMEKEVKQLRRDVEPTGGGSMITPEEMSYLMQYPEEQRGVAIQAMAAFRGQSRGSDSTGSLAPMLVMSMLKNQPQVGVTEMVVALKGLNDIIQTGKAPTSNMDSVVSVARLLLEFKDKDQSSITDLYKKILEERNVDPIAQTESVVNLAKALGMSPQGGLSPEIERIKIQSTETLQQRQHDHELLLKKMEREDQRMETIINAITGPLQTLAGVFAPGIASAVGGAAGAASAQLKAAPQPGGPLSVRCTCGYEPIWVSEETPIAVCPNCGARVTHERFKDRVGAQPAPGGSPPPAAPSSGLPPPPPPPD